MTLPASVAAALQQGDALVHTTARDPRARLVLADLEREYDARYGDLSDEPASVEMNRYGSDAFSPDHGGTFVLLLRDGEPVAAGAFMLDDAGTVEVKRMWTRADQRGRRYAQLVLAELEAEARRRGHAAVVLSTGPRQPEAVALYRRSGYTERTDIGDDRYEGAFYFRKAL